MYLKPLTQFVRSLVTGKRRWTRRVYRPLTNRERRRMGIGSWLAVAAPAQMLEERAMLSGPSLVQVVPNTTGVAITNNQLQTEAPKELTFTFSPGSSIDASTLAAGISITRSGVDSAFGDANDQTITPGFMGVAVAGNGSNQVTLRFADTLPDDLYRISITGALKNTANESFNNGVTQTLDFRVDYGAQVISLVPQPVLRTEKLNVLNFSKISDLDKFTVTAGGAPVTFQFKNTATSSVVGAGNTAILYSSADTAASLAAKINTAINAKFGVGGAVSSTVNSTAVSLAGDAFTPSIKITTAQSGALSVTDGGLVQKRDTIVAYFNQDTLNATLAQDPGYYQVTNTSDGSILLPSSVKYDSVSNTAVLKFAGDIPAGTFHLTIGAPNGAQNTLATAVVAGTLFGNTGGYSVNGFLGNANHTGTALNDVDLYQFNTTAATAVTINASNLASGLGGSVVLRLFDANGVQVAVSNSNSLAVNLAAGGTYYVGVSGTGNATYNPVTGLGVVNGAGVGSYNLGITVANAVTLNNDTTSFATSTDLGTLGASGQKINDAIQPLGNLAYPTLPGGPDEPGHREINVAGENNAGTPWSVGIPGAIPTFYYNFQDVYGVDAQSNTLHNAITEEQKNLARQIFQIYSDYLGIEFVETSNQGLTVVTGDTRAVDPGSPPDALGGIFGTSSIGTVDAIVNASAVPGGASQYGGTWFNIAFHEIGHALGLEHSYDAPSVMGQGVGGNTGVEAVYPGDINLVPAQNLNAPISTDINLYKFQVTQAGTLSAQTIAQRLKDVNGNDAPSLLDTVITLYQESPSGVRTIVARNDDYFGRDSFVNLHLDTGTYYLAVSSTGNTNFDPSVSDTGFGGRTDGAYQLKLDFTADPPATALLNDALGVALDGDGNAATGGVFNFWFQSNTAANTIFVDKANSADVGQNGTIGHAYSTIAAAIATATPGQVIRIVGNGGTDGDPTTLSDDKAYLIGFDTLNNAAADGSTFKVPKGVTVMIDAGAVLKFRGAVIDVGDSVPNVDRSGSSLQVLGTPGNNVYFTSLRDNAKGGNTDPTNFGSPQGGDWGGIVFRQPSDVQGKDFAGNGIYLNSVNQANISFGGGQVLEDSVLQVFDPIHISNPDANADFFARPAIWNNTITNSADAAISADPNSFFNSLDRVGPDIHGNKVTGNTINGLFIRVRTQLGESIDKLGVSARLDDADIAYVLTENLLIEGNPGGPYQPNPNDATHTGWNARTAGALIIDPGIILKINGARIEAQVGESQFLAEGTDAKKIIFTSLRDDTYGAGGTFDTGFDGASAGSAGDYGGLFFNAGSSGSIDRARILFAGGTTPIAGGFTQFNPVEIQQADVRITNTLFQNNADGVTGEDQDPSNGNRNGLLSNTGRTAGTGPGTIFVRGSQPIIVGNTFVDNAGNVLSVNANSLNSLQIVDWGRSTGAIDDFEQFVNNKGPLVRLNTYTGNGTNGMEVRGETITTETTWDDVDIVHVVRDEIIDTLNLHTYGGIRLQSSPEASLVVKLSGENAGFTANGMPLDIDDRIGGTVQIIGTPGHPVVLTALEDDTVGAGFDPSGQPQNDTNNDGTNTDKPLQFPPSTGPLTITKTTSGQTLLTSMLIRPLASGVTLGTATYTGGADAAGTYQNGGSVPLGIYPTGALITNGNAALPTSNTETNFGDEMNTDGDPRLDALIADSGTTTTEASVLTFTVTVAAGSGIHSGRFSFVFGSDEYPEFTNSRYNDVVGAFVNGGAETNFLRDAKGNLISVNNAYFNVDNTNDSLDIEYDGLTQALTASFPLREGVNTITIAIGDASDRILDSGIFLTDLRFSTDVVGKGGVTAVPQAGAWRSVSLEQYSNDTNVAVNVETERIADKKDTNGTPATAEFLGNLAPNASGDTPDNAKGGNDDQTLGFEVHGFLNSTSDADVYSFNGVGGTEVWFDIGRTSASLDTVLELIDANGNVLASSNDSLNSATLGGSAMGMIKDAHLGGDFYTTNPRDAGFRTLLPGPAGTNSTYFIRVRSNNAATQGEYQLQIRLQQVYEHPGSTIRYSDIRYATNGIEIHGLPAHSPLGGTSASVGTNNSFATAQSLGNILTSDQSTINVSGSLATSTQVDWYKFNVDYDLIQTIGGVNAAAKTFAAIFDIDYADGLARPDLTISIYDASGNLVLISRNSDIANDQPAPQQGNDLDDLSRGSVGKLDPFLGTVMLPAGSLGNATGPENGSGAAAPSAQRTYYVAISANTRLPTALEATFKADATEANRLVRLEPVNSIRRIVEDHIGVSDQVLNPEWGTPGYSSGSIGVGVVTHIAPTTGPILPIATTADLALSVKPFTLDDVALYISGDKGNPGSITPNVLFTVNGLNGTAGPEVGQIASGILYDVRSLQFRSDGFLFAYQSSVHSSNSKGNVGQLFAVDTSTGSPKEYALGSNDSIPDVPDNGIPTDADQLSSNTVDSFFWIRNDPNAEHPYSLFYSVRDNQAGVSRLYRANDLTGSAAKVDGEPWGLVGYIDNPNVDLGFTTGMVYGNDGNAYGVTSNGYLIQLNLFGFGGAGLATVVANLGVSFTGVTLGPQNAVGGPNSVAGFYKDMLFTVDGSGNLRAYNYQGVPQAIFANGATSISTGILNAQGLAFSPLDFNLWHPTTQGSTDAGHGINGAFDNSRGGTNGIGDQVYSINGRLTTQSEGGASFYFGLEKWLPASQSDTGGSKNYVIYNDVNAQYGVLKSEYQQDLTLNRTVGGFTPNIGNTIVNGGDNTTPTYTGNYNLPGGAYGSLVTKSFSLESYSSSDLPTLYFDYLLGTQQTQGNVVSATTLDSARVFVSTDGGATWQLVATNNSVRSNPAQPSELPQYLTPQTNDAVIVNGAATNAIGQGQYVQELYDTEDWRQARIDLSKYAGLNNLSLRFDFSTSGSSMSSYNQSDNQPGDETSKGANNSKRTEDNQHIGFFVDDIMVGLAGRGEMVTGGTPNNTSIFTPNPTLENDTNYKAQQLTGAYELGIRRGTDYTVPFYVVNGSVYQSTITPNFPNIALNPDQLDINSVLSDGFSIQALPGSTIADGQTFTISDGVKSVTFEFDSNGSLLDAVNHRAVSFTASDSNYVVARSIRDAINSANSAGKLTSSATLADGTKTGSNSTNSIVVVFSATLVTSMETLPDLSVALNAAAIAENGGSTTGTVTRQDGTGGALSVTLTIIDPATGLPATGVTFSGSGTNTLVISFAGGQPSANFTINASDDSIFNGIRTFIVRPTAFGHTSVGAPVDVTDNETGTLSLTINTPNVNEGPLGNPGIGSATVTRNGSTASDLVVSLSSLSTSEVTVPATVTIPAGATSANFNFTAVQDGTTDGNKVATLVAHASGFIAGTGDVTIVDSLVEEAAPIVGSTINVSKQAGMDINGAVAIDRTNALNRFAAGTSDTVGLLTAYSTDGGSTWTKKVIANGLDTFPVALGTPAVASDNFGNLFVAYLSSNRGTLVLLVSTNFGQTFTQLTTFTGQSLNAPAITTGNGSVWLAWASEGTGGTITAAGAAVTALGTVGTFSNQPVTNSTNGMFPSIAVGPTGKVMVMFQAPPLGETEPVTQGPNIIRFSVDQDGLGTGTFPEQPTTLLTTNVGSSELLFYSQYQNDHGINAAVGLAWDRTGGAHDGRLYAVYTSEDINTFGQYDVVMRYSDNNGLTWSNTIQLNDDGLVSAQFFPRISIDQTTGNVAVIWYDTRNDYAFGPGNTDGFTQDEVQVFGTIVSYPNGVFNVGPNVQISAGSSSTISSQFQFSENFGDRIGLDFHAGKLAAVWADNSAALTGNPDAPRLELATAGATVGFLTPLPTASVTINPASVTEGGNRTGTVTLSGPAPKDMYVLLQTNDSTLASVSTFAFIAAGQTTGNFTIQSTDNAVASGTQTLVVQPFAPGYKPVGAILRINDNETPQIGLSVSSNVAFEGNTLTGTVTRNGPTDNQLVVNLYSTDTTEVNVPLTVIIPAGLNSVDFAILLPQDFVVDGTHTPSIVAFADGFRSSTSQVSVLDSGVETATDYTLRGDKNLPRRQGVINISSNTIRDVANTGILVNAPPRDGADANLPHQGSVINTPTLNSDKLLPGPQISNNVIYNFGQTGIQFSGDANAAGTPIAGVPYGRIVNNSIYAGATAHGTGILVSNNAAPTLLNNIVSNTDLGISIDSTSSAKTVVGTTLFKGNTSNGVLGTNAIVLSAAQPLFNNPSTGNFYLAPGSLAIDSSLNTLVDRPSIVSVKSPLGIPQSPIIAPSLDRFGQLRIDEPSVPNANGLGQNIFKDRGALERADFAGPTARLDIPEDNSIADGDPAVGRFVVITPAPLIEFDIVLEDQGIGIDNSTVSSSAFVLRQDPGTPDEKVLVNGVDYIFSYNENTHTAAFKAVSVFPPASTYTITLDTTVVKDSAGNALQPNKPDGTSVFMIVGNAPPTLTNVSLLPGLRNVVNSISYATLLANSDLKVITTHTPDFRIESVVAGTLTISKGGAPAVAVVPGTTLVEPGDVLFWDPPAGAEGQTAAFTVIGYDPENAVIAPALSLSITGPVTVSLNLVNVAPTLTTISTLPTHASEDTAFSITYDALKNQSDLVDQNNDSPLSFLINEVTTGTLQISINGAPYVAVVPGSTTFGPNDVLRWQAPANQNNDLNGNSPFNAFKVLATDGDATSPLPAVQVKIDVDAVPDAPIMTSLTKFGVGGLNSQFPILYADLVSHSNVQNVDGHPIQFRIESIAAGATLKIKHLGVVSTVVPGTATAIVSAGDSLFWTPPLGVFGTSVAAFNVVAYDGLNSSPSDVSTPQLTANVEVLNSPAPTLSTIATFTRPRYVPTPLSFSDIQAASNVTIAAGHTLGFRIESIETGVLQITHLGATTVAGPGTIVVAGDTLTWASAPGATDLNNAFKVVAVDLTNTLVSLEPIQVQVNLINFAPTLSTVTPFGGAIQQTPYNITYASLQSAANEFDANNDALGFRIRWVFNGTLLITKAGTSTAVPVVNAQTLVQPGDVLTWTGGVGQNGAIPAFAIRAWDGLAGSGVDINVTVNVAAFGTQYSLSGPWVVGGKLARINQVGANLTLSDQNGVGSAGSYTSFNTITGRNGLTGIVDTTTPDNGRIVWSDGAIWLKLSVGGQYYIPAAGDALVKVIQNGVALKFYNKFGDSADASFISPTLISIPKWNLTATYADGALNISNGVQWKKLDLSPTYTDSATGQKVGVIQKTDTTDLTFVDTVGGTSPGFWTSPTQVTATAWGKTGIVKNGQIVWSDGSIWNKSLVVVGTGSGAGPGFVTITATNNQILLTNKLGTVMRTQIIDPYTLYNIDTGKTIIRKNGKLDLGGGLIWADFDYNALDAVFSDIKTFPFGS